MRKIVIGACVSFFMQTAAYAACDDKVDHKIMNQKMFKSVVQPSGKSTLVPIRHGGMYTSSVQDWRTVVVHLFSSSFSHAKKKVTWTRKSKKKPCYIANLFKLSKVDFIVADGALLIVTIRGFMATSGDQKDITSRLEKSLNIIVVGP